MNTNKLFELHEIETGFLLITPTTQSAIGQTKAFHNDSVRDEREKMLNEFIKLLNLKQEFGVVRRRE